MKQGIVELLFQRPGIVGVSYSWVSVLFEYGCLSTVNLFLFAELTGFFLHACEHFLKVQSRDQ